MKIIAAAVTLQCAAAVWLIVSPPGQSPWPGITLLGLTLLTAGAVLFALRAHRKRMRALHETVRAFLYGGVEPPCSLTEDAYAEIENDIAEMAQRMLRQREAMARESRETLDFISDVSHQLKTPLASLKLYGEMREQDEKQLILIEHMETLIYSLLRLQKLKVGTYEMCFATHDMAVLAAEVMQEISVLYPQKKFYTDIRDGVFRFDEYWMGEAIGNVIKNACEHTAEDGHIRISMERNDNSVSIAVQDDGGGVPPEELPRLFQRFYRSSTRLGGTGLGLAITRTIIEKHHGNISARNGEKGLQVVICLPLLSGKLPVS